MHHSDGSLHLILSPSDAITVLSARWGERHPLAGMPPGLPLTYVLVYPPRDKPGASIVAQLPEAAIDHMAQMPPGTSNPA